MLIVFKKSSKIRENGKGPEQRREHRDLTSEDVACDKTAGLINSWSGAHTFPAVTNKMFKTRSACGGFGAMEKANETVERARVLWKGR
jgi:hypothetical protein